VEMEVVVKLVMKKFRHEVIMGARGKVGLLLSLLGLCMVVREEAWHSIMHTAKVCSSFATVGVSEASPRDSWGVVTPAYNVRVGQISEVF